MTQQEQAFPLSGLQLRRLTNAEHTVHNEAGIQPVSALYHCPPGLDKGTLKAAAIRIAQQHESLRTVLIHLPGVDQALQQLNNEARVSCNYHSLQAADDASQSIINDSALQPAELRIHYWHDTQHGTLRIEADPVFVDRPSLDLIARQLIGATPETKSDHAARFKTDTGADDEAVQYIDFVQWHNEQLAATPDQSPNDHTNPALALEAITRNPANTAVHRHQFHINAEQWLALQNSAQRYQLSPETLLFSHWQLLLSQFSDRQPVTIGWYSTGRNDELSDAIGVYECHLPITMERDAQQVFDLLLANERQRQQQQPLTIDWQRHSPTAYAFEWYNANDDLQRDQHDPLMDGSRLKLNIAPDANGCCARIDYHPAYFNQHAIEHLADCFQALWACWLTQPETAIADLAIPGAPTLLFGADHTVPPDDDDSETVLQRFENYAHRYPSAPAIYFRDTELSYGELNRQANQLAHRLLADGPAWGNHIGIYAQRSAEWVVAMLAILKTGAAYVALDPEYPQQRLQQMVHQGQLSRVIIIGTSHPEFISVPVLDYTAERSRINQYSDQAPAQLLASQQTAYLIFTSGSTGQPKAVAVSHAALAASTRARQQFYPHTPSCFLLLSSFAFDSSIAGLFWSLSSGAALCLPEPAGELNLLGLAALIRKHRVSHLLCLPALYRALLEQGFDSDSTRTSELKGVIVAGESCPLALIEKHHQQWPNVLLTNEYGPTETTVWCSAYSLSPDTDVKSLRYVPIGQAIPGTALYVLDQQLMPVSKGLSGELYIGGRGVSHGYWQQGAASAARFLPDPFSSQPGARMYRSGDRVRLRSDGELEFLGRIDHQVKIRGHRIELSEIERQLLSHPQIQNSAVIATAGIGDAQQLVAFIESADITQQQAINHVEQHLPRYMVPARWLIQQRLPTTANGKVDRKQLEQQWHAQADDHTNRIQRAPYAPPNSEAEVILCTLCSELMKIDPVGIHDNFFHLGGDSILSLQLVARAAKHGLEITPQELFEHPVLADAARIARACAITPDTATDDIDQTATTDTTQLDIELNDDQLTDLLSEVE